MIDDNRLELLICLHSKTDLVRQGVFQYVGNLVSWVSNPVFPPGRLKSTLLLQRLELKWNVFWEPKKTAMNSVSPYYINLILSYSYCVCYCLQWVDTSLIQQFLNLTSPDFLSYLFNFTLDLHCNFVFRMEIRWWQTKLDVKTLIFKHL